MQITSFRDLIVWQKSVDLVILVYKLTENFPKSELFGLTSQMRRSAVSIPANIAEGRTRGSRKDFRHFLINSLASASELETHIEIAKRLYNHDIDTVETDGLLKEVLKMLQVMVSKLKT